MPERKQIRALLAVHDTKASSALRGYFRARGDVAELSPGADVFTTIREQKPDVIVLEIDKTSDLLGAVCHQFPQIPVVAVGQPTNSLVFAAGKLGASELLPLPLDEEEAGARLSGVLGSLCGAHVAETAPADGFPSHLTEIPFICDASPRMVEIRETIEKVANTSATVLIRGESGVGKELAARLIFARSMRCRKPFVKVNCAAIPHDLLESELFGYEAGAFTGAQRAKPGKFELADGGTLFLDEIAEMHPALQAKLLHVLQDGEFARLGAKRDTAVDVRVICATNKLLEERVAEGLFREDLFYRVNVVTVHIPPLRERRDEIPLLIRYFIKMYCQVYQRAAEPFDDRAMQALTRYGWPGNIRELENLCKRYVIVGDATQIVRELSLRVVDLPSTGAETAIQAGPDSGASPGGSASSLGPSLLEIGRQAAWRAERIAIQQMLAETRWNRREAARRLQVSYKALLNKIKQIEVENSGQRGNFTTH